MRLFYGLAHSAFSVLTHHPFSASRSSLSTMAKKSLDQVPATVRSFGKTDLRMASTLPRLSILDAISKHDPETTAVVHCVSGRSFKYGELLPDIARAHERLLQAAGTGDIRGQRIAFLVENSYDYVGMENSSISRQTRRAVQFMLTF
jgi:hypothetical protein